MNSNLSPNLAEVIAEALSEGDCTIATGGYTFVFQSADNGYKLLANEVTSKAFGYYSSNIVKIDDTFYADDIQDLVCMLGAFFFYTIEEPQVNKILATITKDLVRNNGALRYTHKGMTFDIYHLENGMLGLGVNDGNRKALVRGAMGSEAIFDNKQYTSRSFITLLEIIAPSL